MNILKKLFLLVGYGFASLLTVLFAVFAIVFFVGSRGVFDVKDVKKDSGLGVGLAKLEGEISDVSTFEKRVNQLLKDDNVKTIVARIDSPGGSVGASEEAYRVLKFADSKKPVVCSFGNSAASGGLFAAMGCRKIVSNKGTITGSIGVIMMSPYVGKIAETVRAEMNVIKSGQFNDAGSPFRPMEEKDRGLLQNLVDQAHSQFVSTIAQSRSLEPAVVQKFADGRIILGESAKELGLIDSFGGIREAAKLSLELAGIEGEPEILDVPATDKFLKFFRKKIEGFAPILRAPVRSLALDGPKQLYHSGF